MSFDHAIFAREKATPNAATRQHLIFRIYFHYKINPLNLGDADKVEKATSKNETVISLARSKFLEGKSSLLLAPAQAKLCFFSTGDNWH